MVRKMFAKHGFTLVELLIVVIIIGILAAVALPQFGDSATDAKRSSLDASLSTMRNAIQLYYHQHNSTNPGVVATHKAGAGEAAAHSDEADAFAKQLTMYSDAAGNTSDTRDPDNFPYGPYLRMGMPRNPLPAAGAIATPEVVSVVTDAGQLTADAEPKTGWKMSNVTGQIIANNADYETR